MGSGGCATTEDAVLSIQAPRRLERTAVQPFAWRGLDIAVEITGDQLELTVGRLDVSGRISPASDDLPRFRDVDALKVAVHGEDHVVSMGETLRLSLDCHGPRLGSRSGRRPQTGGTRADGSKITAGVPDPGRHREPDDSGVLPVVPAVFADQGVDVNPDHPPD